jgi:capsular exopolysaccharide synthesis family protein
VTINILAGFSSPEEITEALNVPVFGEIPWTPSVERANASNLRAASRYPFVALPDELDKAVQNLRHAIGLLGKDTAPKVIQITSTISSEGKSTISMMLTAAVAEAGLNVVLVDASIRNPKLSQALMMHYTPGLAELLDGATTVQVLQQSLRRCEALNATFMSAGQTRKNSVELLASGKLKPIITSLRSAFDLIIIDSPSVDFLVDSVVVSEISDKLIYVVRHGFPPREQVMAAIQRISPYKAVSGVVLNQVRSAAIRTDRNVHSGRAD